MVAKWESRARKTVRRNAQYHGSNCLTRCHWYSSLSSELIKAFGFARDMFVRPQLLPPRSLEKTILEAFYRFYDNATNGNRTRGGMKNAFQTYSPPPPNPP